MHVHVQVQVVTCTCIHVLSYCLFLFAYTNVLHKSGCVVYSSIVENNNTKFHDMVYTLPSTLPDSE